MAKNNECIENRDNSYRVKISYIDETGKRKYYSKSFSIKKYGSKQKALEYAKKYRDDIRVKINNNIAIKHEKKTLKEVYNLSMDLYQCTLETKRKLKLLFNKYILNELNESIYFENIKYNDIQRTLNKMISIASDDSIKRVFSIWKRLYKYALACDLVIRDETIKVEIPKSELIEKKRPMNTDINQLMDICNRINDSSINKRDKILLQGALWIMWYTGMRPAEVFALNIENIDLNNKLIYVCQSLGSTSTQFNTIRRTKNDNSIRYIPLSDQLIPIIKELSDISIDGYLFIRDNGSFLNSTILSNITRKVSDKSFRPYMLRHQFSTDLILDGVDIRTIQELMGHADSSMTISYARSNQELKRNALNNRSQGLTMIENKA